MFIKSLLTGLNKVCFRGFSTELGSAIVKNVLRGTDQGIVVIGLNNHNSRNALGKDLTHSLSQILDDLSVDSEIRVLVIRSLVPKVFCAGANLKERLAMTESEVKNYVNFLRNLMLKIENIPVPVIAAIDGAALGGGLEMALACDIRIASTKAKLGLVETKLAILPGAGGTQRLPRLIGASLAKELIFTSRILNGVEAKQYGIVNHCTDANNVEDSAYQKALEIAREILPNGPLGIKYAKLAINKGIEVDINQGCAIEELCYSQIIPSKDRIEGLKAFLEKRPPLYSGE